MCRHQPACCNEISFVVEWCFFGGGIRFIFLYEVVLFVHRKCVADCGTMGELTALYKRKIPYKSKFVAISEFGGISRGGTEWYNCILFM